jgi:integrase
MVRIREYMDKVRNDAHRAAQAAEYCERINRQLAKGWRPWNDTKAGRLMVPLADMLATFMEAKAKELRPRSLPNYRSRIKRLLEWADSVGRGGMACHELTDRVAREYMDAVSLLNGARTWNNYLIDMKSLGNWGTERGYFERNPWAGIKKRMAGEAEKRPLSSTEMEAMLGHIQETEPTFMVVCSLVYYCALRPAEICRLKVAALDLVAGTIYISPDQAKDKEGRHITLPDIMRPLLAEHIRGARAADMLISSGWRPGPAELWPTRLAEAWGRHRAALGLSGRLKLYGLKDTAGKRMLAAGFNPEQVRDHFRHSSLTVTDAYIKRVAGRIDPAIKERFPAML